MACLASFRQLFIRSAQGEPSDSEGSSKLDSWHQRLLSAFDSIRSRSRTTTHEDKDADDQGGRDASTESHERMFPLQAIKVDRHFESSSYSLDQQLEQRPMACVHNTAFVERPLSSDIYEIEESTPRRDNWYGAQGRR